MKRKTKIEQFRAGDPQSSGVDEPLISAIRGRLQVDPDYYLNILRILIDEIQGDLPDEILFESLNPAFIQIPSIDEVLSGRKMEPSENIDYTIMPSPESVDMLFYPYVRNKLKEWQRVFYHPNSTESQRIKAEENISKVFSSLIFKESGRPQALTPKQRNAIKNDYRDVHEICKEIFKKSKRGNDRNLHIKEKFPDVGKKIVEDIISCKLIVRTSESLRNVVLAKRYKCSERNVDDFMREERRPFKLLYKSGSKTITLTGSGKHMKLR